MSLAAVCVDRGRVLIKEPTGPRIEGRTQFQTVPGQWFKCRLFLMSTTDVPDPQSSHWLSQSAPQLLCLPHDLDGRPLVLRSDYAIDVRSKELADGNAIWRMAGEPEPLRKKRRVIGYLAFVEREIERTFDDLLDTNRLPDLGPPSVS